MLGYLLYGASIFFPGAFVTLAMGVARRLTAIEFITFSFGVGTAASWYAYSLATFLFGGIDPIYVVMMTIASALGSIPLLKGGRPQLRVRRGELGALVILAGYVITLLTYFGEYPIFPPEGGVHDPYYYYRTALGIASGNVDPFASWFRTVDYNLAGGMVALDQIRFLSMIQSARLLAVPFPLIIYFTAYRLSGREVAALLSSFLSAFSFGIWLTGVGTTGLYANFLSLMLTSLFLWVLLEYLPRPQRSWMMTIAFLLPPLLLSHPTVLIFFLALLITIPFMMRSRFSEVYRSYVRLVKLGIVVFVVTLPFTITRLLEIPAYLKSESLYYYAANPITDLLAFSPYLVTLYNYLGGPGFFVLIASFAALLVKLASRRGALGEGLCAIWFSIPIALSFVVPIHNAWRLSFPALLPSLFIIGSSLDGLTTRLRGLARPGASKALPIVLLATLSLGMALYGTTGYVAYDVSLDRGFAREKQVAVLESMLWIGENLPGGTRIASIGLPYYTYLPHIVEREHEGEWLYQGTGPIEFVFRRGVSLVAVDALLRNSTHVITELFDADGRFEPIWSNRFVVIYRVRG